MSNDSTILGKFKTVEALKNAYDSLQKEFTKKCQKLSRITKEEDNEARDDVIDEPSVAKAVLPADASFVDEASGFSPGETRVDEKYDDADNPEEQRVPCGTDESFSLTADFVEKYILSNSELLDMVLERYLRQITMPSSPKLIGATGAIGLAPCVKPVSIEEAGKMAERLFKK